MAKLGWKYALCLSSSIFFNILFLSFLLRPQEPRLTWSREAAREAEAIASLSCSGHGRAYLDGLVSQGKPVCLCHTCYEGPDCSDFSPGCPADVDSGDPLFLEPYWMRHAASSAILVAGYHRMSYRYNDSTISTELQKQILQLHAVVGNANTTGRFMVFGTGSTQLLYAAVNALSRDASPSPASVVTAFPFYSVYETQTNLFNSLNSKWQGDSAQWKNVSNPSTNVIEFVTSPNNPDCKLREPVLSGPNVKTVHDHAYYWPHYTAIPAPANEDLMIFTISKITGHAGSRFGWALIKDERVYERMITYVTLNSIGVSHDTQLRALKLLKAIQKDGGKELFEFGYKTIRERWEKLSKRVSASKRFSVPKLAPRYCTYFQKITGPSPAYAWLKCENEEDKDCYAVLKAAGIIGRAGAVFGADSRYVRLSLLKSQDDFDLLMQRIESLVSEEDGPRSI
ncbi:PREDICTED: tryptophan aminotransferase-related protein 3-like [Nelumbo nucifera]|uniref:Tryptophan aminotransferase-related protein 3-like n=1 Tax=Nelumbo nucifera TaxID=4432 RepID=A0A1U8A7J4_NELNU|nr:PREDICTED: tryptophan aminotransferase-related protein 3-like [Nelumbo nucifera]